MTKATREDNGVLIRCFPNEKLLDALSRLLTDEDGTPVDFKIVGKRYIPGDMEKEVSKFHGRTCEVTTDKTTIRINISDV